MSCHLLCASDNNSPAHVSSYSSHIVGLLPARWGSSRFPGKPLHLLAGKPLIQHVWERCQGCRLLDRIMIATDDRRIADAAHDFGAEVVMTSPDHPTGTDRVAEAAAQLPEASHVINIQGDEPLIDPSLIDAISEALISDPSLPMVTAANVLEDDIAFHDPNVVKVVLDQSGHALYFSRSPLPYVRVHPLRAPRLRHKGIYGYRKDFLEKFVNWVPTPLEIAESLEQLRALENGARIKVILTDDDSIGLDTPEQAPIVESLLLSLSSYSSH